MAVWSIKIVPGAKPGDLASFVPQLQQPGPGGTFPDGLYADSGDAVSWDNTLGSIAHHPIPTDENYKPLKIPPADELSRQIPPGGSSRPAYIVAEPATGNTIFYCCALHSAERGKITVTS
jgi:hypothetical protein